MNQPAFDDRNDFAATLTDRRWLVWLCVLIAMICFVLGCALYLASEVLSLGRITDLPNSELQAIDEMQTAGILVREAPLQGTFKPHVVLTVKWSSQHRQYCVERLGLRSMQIERLLPYVDRFPGLTFIDAPYLHESERARIAALIPGLIVTKRE